MVNKRINRLALALARSLTADWHASIKLTSSEWQQLLESDVITIYRPFNRVLWNLEQEEHKAVKLTGPTRSGSVEAMITDIFRGDSGDYEIEFQLTSHDVGRRTYSMPPVPTLEPGEFVIYETLTSSVPYVVVWRSKNFSDVSSFDYNRCSVVGASEKLIGSIDPHQWVSGQVYKKFNDTMPCSSLPKSWGRQSYKFYLNGAREVKRGIYHDMFDEQEEYYARENLRDSG